jgi:hypothetical protein
MQRDEVPTKVLIAEWVWTKLKDGDKEGFKAEVRRTLAVCYPNLEVIRFEKPFMICRRKEG